jgi:hypothetical protein
MKEIKINKNSWHFHLIENYTSINPNHINNTCTYAKSIFYGLLGMLFFIALGAFLINCLFLQPLITIIFGLSFGFDLPIVQHNLFLTIGVSMWLMIIFCCLSFIIKTTYKFISHKFHWNPRTKKDNFLSLMYESIKNKICFRIIIE